MKISIAYMRDLERQVAKGKITYIRMVELLNEKADERCQQKLMLNYAGLAEVQVSFGIMN